MIYTVHIFGMDVRDEIEKRKQEKELGYEEILSVHPTSYNSSGDSTDSDNKGGRPSGSDDEHKQEYDSDYNLTRV